MPSPRSWQCLLLGHEEAESKSLLLGRAMHFLSRGDASYSAMKKPSRKVFYSAAEMRSTQPWLCLLLGHEEAESEGLPLGHGDTFYLAATMPLTRP